MFTHFKTNQHITLDWYAFEADTWYQLGGDFLCDPSPESLMKVFR